MATDTWLPLGVGTVVWTHIELCKVQLCDEAQDANKNENIYIYIYTNKIYGYFNKRSSSVPKVQEYDRMHYSINNYFRV